MSDLTYSDLGLNGNDLDDLGVSLENLLGPGSSHPPADNSGLDSEEDVRLWAQNQRFQAAVMRAMDESVGVLENQLRDKAVSLNQANQAREDLALGLQRMRGELARAVQGLNNSRKNLDEAIASRREALTELSTTQRELGATRRRVEQTEAELIQTRRSLNSVIADQHTLRQLQTATESELKISKQLCATVQSELELRAGDLQKVTQYGSQQQSAVENMAQQVVALKQQVQQQEALVKTAEMATQGYKKAAEEANNSKEAVLKQWQAALAAMEQRDQALRVLTAKHSETHEELRLERAMHTQREKELMSLQDQHQEVAQGLEKESDKATNTLALLRRADADNRSLKAEVDQLKSTVTLLNNDVDTKTKAEAALKSQLDAARERVHVLLSETEELKKQTYHTNSELSRQGAVFENRERKLKGELEQQVRDAEQQSVNAENEKNLTRLKLLAVEEDLRLTKDQNGHLDKEYQDVLRMYQDSYAESKSLEDQLERAVYKANQAQHKTATSQKQAELDKDALITASESEIASLKSKLNDQRKKFDDLSKVFLETQQKVLAAHNKEKSVFDSAASLHHQLSMAQAVSDRYRRTADSMQSKFQESVRETDETRLDLVKSQQTVTQLQQQVKMLERKLNDAGFYEQTKRAEQQAELSAMKSQLVHHQHDNKDWSTLLQSAHRERLNAETQAQLNYEKLQACMKKLHMSEREVSELKQVIKLHSNTQSVAKKQMHQWNKQFDVIFQKQLQKRLAHVNSIDGTSQNAVQSGSGSGANNTGTNTSDAMFLQELVGQLKQELHKVASVNAERTGEITRLRQQINAYALSDQDRVVREDAYVGKVRELFVERKTLQASLQSAQQRRMRAEGIAVSLEYQLRQTLFQQLTAGMDAKAIMQHNHDHDHDAQSHGSRGRLPASVDEVPIDLFLYANATPSAALNNALDGQVVQTPLHTHTHGTSQNNNNNESSLTNHTAGYTSYRSSAAGLLPKLQPLQPPPQLQQQLQQDRQQTTPRSHIKLHSQSQSQLLHNNNNNNNNQSVHSLAPNQSLLELVQSNARSVEFTTPRKDTFMRQDKHTNSAPVLLPQLTPTHTHNKTDGGGVVRGKPDEQQRLRLLREQALKANKYGSGPHSNEGSGNTSMFIGHTKMNLQPQPHNTSQNVSKMKQFLENIEK